MVIAGWRKNFEILAFGGERPCANCRHTTRHFLVGERKEIRLYFVPVARFGRKRHLICDVCAHMTEVSEQEAGRIVQGALEPPAPSEPEHADWQEAGKRGFDKAIELLVDTYGWPWTLEHLDMGLRGDLPETLFRFINDEVTKENGALDEATLSELRRIAHDGSRLIRAQAAIASAIVRVRADGVHESEASEIVGEVCSEMGVSHAEAEVLAKEALSSMSKEYLAELSSIKPPSQPSNTGNNKPMQQLEEQPEIHSQDESEVGRTPNLDGNSYAGDSWAAGPRTAPETPPDSASPAPAQVQVAAQIPAAIATATPLPTPVVAAPVTPVPKAIGGPPPAPVLPAVKPGDSVGSPPSPPPASLEVATTAESEVDGAFRGKPVSSRRVARKVVVWTMVASMAAAGGVVGTLYFKSGAEPDKAAALAPLQKQSSLPAPQGFTAARGEDGRTTYTSRAKSFSISLPNGWGTNPAGSHGTNMLFNALDRDPSYSVSTELGTPQLLVSRFKALDILAPRKFMQRLRTIYYRNPRTSGKVELYRDRLPAGSVHIFRFVRRLNFGTRNYTIFMVLHDGFWYQLVFGVPTQQGSSYLPVFDSIAQTLTFV